MFETTDDRHRNRASSGLLVAGSLFAHPSTEARAISWYAKQDAFGRLIMHAYQFVAMDAESAVAIDRRILLLVSMHPAQRALAFVRMVAGVAHDRTRR